MSTKKKSAPAVDQYGDHVEAEIPTGSGFRMWISGDIHRRQVMITFEGRGMSQEISMPIKNAATLWGILGEIVERVKATK